MTDEKIDNLSTEIFVAGYLTAALMEMVGNGLMRGQFDGMCRESLSEVRLNLMHGRSLVVSCRIEQEKGLEQIEHGEPEAG